MIERIVGIGSRVFVVFLFVYFCLLGIGRICCVTEGPQDFNVRNVATEFR